MTGFGYNVALAIIGVWALLHVAGGSGGATDPFNFFFESSTMGTILVLVVYLLASLALPFYYRRYRPTEFHAVKHGVLPPYDWFPYAALIIVAVAAVYAFILTSRDSSLAGRVGSLVADE